jgi:hypothetical protein
MKTKLLKKIRKRYTITYHPEQVWVYGHRYVGDCLILRDTTDSMRSICGIEITKNKPFQKWFSLQAATKEEARKLMLEVLCKWIERDYHETRTRVTRESSELLWYKP